jgi:hypothetical protein
MNVIQRFFVFVWACLMLFGFGVMAAEHTPFEGVHIIIFGGISFICWGLVWVFHTGKR